MTYQVNQKKIEMAGKVSHLTIPDLYTAACTVNHHDPIVKLIVYDCLIV